MDLNTVVESLSKLFTIDSFSVGLIRSVDAVACWYHWSNLQYLSEDRDFVLTLRSILSVHDIVDLQVVS